jgi:hypothetical protein
MKTTLEKIFLSLLIAPLAPLAGGMGAWVLAYLALPEPWFPYTVLAGLLLGMTADIFILKKLLTRCHQLSLVFWLSVLLFYAVGLFGLFMGVPIFHVLLAIPAGFVMGGRLAAEKADSPRLRKTTNKTCLVTTGLLALTCMSSAFFALASPSTPADLQGMLGLDFSVTPVMLWGLILAGGSLLLVVNWALTALSTHLAYRFLR